MASGTCRPTAKLSAGSAGHDCRSYQDSSIEGSFFDKKMPCDNSVCIANKCEVRLAVSAYVADLETVKVPYFTAELVRIEEDPASGPVYEGWAQGATYTYSVVQTVKGNGWAVFTSPEPGHYQIRVTSGNASGKTAEFDYNGPADDIVRAVQLR